MYFYIYVYSCTHITFGLCLPEVKCIFYKCSIINVSCCYWSSAALVDKCFMKFHLASEAGRLRSSSAALRSARGYRARDDEHLQRLRRAVDAAMRLTGQLTALESCTACFGRGINSGVKGPLAA